MPGGFISVMLSPQCTAELQTLQKCDAREAKWIDEPRVHNISWQQICQFFLMKKPFNLSIVLSRIEKAVKQYPKAAMFELYERGYSTLFEQLISCIISIRTLDETTIPLSEKLFKIARVPIGKIFHFVPGVECDLCSADQHNRRMIC